MKRATDFGRARVSRVCRGVPPHYHEGSDEYLYVLSGGSTFWTGDASNSGELGPGDPPVFQTADHTCAFRYLRRGGRVSFRGHSYARFEGCIFVNPEDGTPESFIKGSIRNSSAVMAVRTTLTDV
jgi:hypothetical protein